MLGIMTLASGRLRQDTLIRYAFIGCAALLFTAPSWLPVQRGLDVTNIDAYTGGQTPWILHTSLLNLFWPWQQNSLTGVPEVDTYDGKFAMQVGIVPSLGFLAGIVM